LTALSAEVFQHELALPAE
jgi:pilus assembly protein Flp/PilA